MPIPPTRRWSSWIFRSDPEAVADPAAYQAERRALQATWRQRLRGESHLWHAASNVTEFELVVERMKDELRGLRRSFRSWQRVVLAALVALLLLGGGLWWTVFRQRAEVQKVQETVEKVQENAEARSQRIEAELARVQPEEIKTQLRKTIEATYQKELQEADTLKDWQKRADARKDAAVAKDRRLGQVDEFLASINNTIKAGDASPEFLELTRIIQEQGVDEALKYVTGQESRLLSQAEKRNAENRTTLARFSKQSASTIPAENLPRPGRSVTSSWQSMPIGRIYCTNIIGR